MQIDAQHIEPPTANEISGYHFLSTGGDFEGGGMTYQRYCEVDHWLQTKAEIPCR